MERNEVSLVQHVQMLVCMFGFDFEAGCSPLKMLCSEIDLSYLF